MTFDQAIDELLKHEGGYVNHINDPGGETNFGITARVARLNGYEGDMKFIPMSLVKEIYRRDYWDKCKCDDLPETLRYAVFDAGVNSGVTQAIRWLQRASGAVDDGVFGSKTLLAVRMQNPEILKRKYLAQRLNFMTDLKVWPSFSRGWAKRIASLMEA